MPTSRPAPAPPPSPAAEAAQALAGHADELLAAGAEITALVPALRAALRAVPDAERAAMALPLTVFKLLIADVLALVAAEAAADGGPCELSDDEADAMGAFWFSAACGEVRPA